MSVGPTGGTRKTTVGGAGGGCRCGVVPALPANVTLKSASAISDGGHIVGRTSSDHAFLLTPQ